MSGQPYDMTERDIFRNNRDLIDRCGELLATQTWTHLRALRRKRQLVVETVGLDRLDIFVDGHPSGPSIRLRGTAHTESRPRWADTIEVVAFQRGALRERRREPSVTVSSLQPYVGSSRSCSPRPA